jgi:metacaspase-1
MSKNVAKPGKHALLVGINDYKSINDLNGCVNDVTNIRNILKTFFGYTNDDIRVLTDERATKKNILFRLENMVKKAKTGDHLVFHYSGHGSQIRDRDNDELKDHMDELICPYNMNWDDGYITDDMLRVILDQLPEGVKMEIILDSCHSGTGTREPAIIPASSEDGVKLFRNRYLPPPADIVCRYQGDEDRLLAPRSFRSDESITLNHVLWAGCRDNQTSADAFIDGRYNGAFSYYFCKHIRENRGNITRSELISRISDSLDHNDYSQLPQLECRENIKSEKVFS